MYKFNISESDAEQLKILFTDDILNISKLFAIHNDYESKLNFLNSLTEVMPDESFWCWDYYDNEYYWQREYYNPVDMLDKYGFLITVERFYKSYVKYNHKTKRVYIAIHNDNFTNNK